MEADWFKSFCRLRISKRSIY